MRLGLSLGDIASIAVAILVVVGVIGAVASLALGALARERSLRRFGESELTHALLTDDPRGRRVLKAALAVMGLLFFASAYLRPQYGAGTRLVPATNVDVVLVIDYSKSMYARDVAPSRIQRAKAEVAQLIGDLPGVRFGAVAFAGEPISFPLTSDGPAIAQFFRQLNPNDMPVGGTATARALVAAEQLFSRDPSSADHVRVIVLVTDGEDLEGHPETVAQDCAQKGIRIDVVQVGGRAPEVIPDVGPTGGVRGVRRDDRGEPLTTQLTERAESQMKLIADVSGGRVVRPQDGGTGIDVIAKDLAARMSDELSERVETVYSDIYAWPLGVGVALLFIDTWLGEVRRRKRRRVRLERRRA